MSRTQRSQSYIHPVVMNLPPPPVPTERDMVAAEVAQIALANKGRPESELADDIVEWHLRTLESTRANLWIPGMAGRQSPAVEEALSRFHQHQVKRTIERLGEEIARLRIATSLALDCVDFYASGSTDGGDCAKAALRALLASSPRASEQQRSDGGECG